MLAEPCQVDDAASPATMRRRAQIATFLSIKAQCSTYRRLPDAEEFGCLCIGAALSSLVGRNELSFQSLGYRCRHACSDHDSTIDATRMRSSSTHFAAQSKGPSGAHPKSAKLAQLMTNQREN